MSRLETAERMLASLSGVPMHRLTSGSLTAWERKEVVRASAEMASMLLSIDDTASRTMTDIAAVCRRMKRDRKGGLDFVVIDYLQMIEAENSSGRETRETQVAQISKRLKRLARELDVPVIAVSQLSRSVESRQTHIPMLSDLRESGSIEQDADVVILLHREDAYEKDSPRMGEADIIVAKHRNGPTATVVTAFQGHYSRFVDMHRG